MSEQPDPESARRQQLKDDLPFYARHCLKIRTKAEAIKPLVLNSAQRYIHEKLEKQKATLGYVRALILKGRQQGCSTYVEARFYHAATQGFGLKAFILTHEDPATRNIFEMATRFHDHCPSAVKASTKASNARELLFGELDSGYAVATAGTKGVGRSATYQLFHGSEVALWPHAKTHAAGALQTVPNTPGTEVILETTSQGPRGYFYEEWKKATKGEGKFIAIFVPWFWQDEYRADATGLEPTAEEVEYQRLYGVDNEQLAWRRDKISELHGIHHFRREYPATPEEAFSAEVPGALWGRALIEKMRRAEAAPFRVGAISLDPATTSTETSDEWGEIWGGLGMDGHVYVCGDETQIATPLVAAQTALGVKDREDLDIIIYEANQGGDMVPTIIHMVEKTAVCKSVSSSKGKRARAEPVHALCEQGMVHIVGELPLLEDEMATWDANSNESPNRIDAFVQLVTHLLIKRKSKDVKPPDPDAGYTGRKWDA